MLSLGLGRRKVFEVSSDQARFGEKPRAWKKAPAAAASLVEILRKKLGMAFGASDDDIFSGIRSWNGIGKGTG